MLPMVTYHTHRTVLDYWVSDKAWPQTSLGMDWVQGQSGQVIKIYLFCILYSSVFVKRIPLHSVFPLSNA